MPKIPFWVFIVIAILYFTAIRVDTMDIDASQYASMSREMLSSHNWLQLYDRGLEYLDKPPFLIWISALSMKIFGVGNFGYKLPSLLFALWALYATYKLAKLLYTENTARAAALILGTCQGMFLMTNDVRCDTILMSWVITALWMIKEWDLSRRYKYLFLGFAATGFGMMTKGPIALMVPVFCFATDWALKREWKKFFNPAYILGLIIIAIVLLPMSIGLYQQFDMHPEKIVNGEHGVSGLRFFYWSQSFGRITGESPWNNGAYKTFLLEQMLWSYLPWILVFAPAMIVNIVKLVQQKFRLQPNQEWITTGGFILTYLSLASSKYQLPHYIFVVFPLASIMCARFIAEFLEEQKYKTIYLFLKPVLLGVTCLLLAFVLVLVGWVFYSGPVAFAMWTVGAGIVAYIAFKAKPKGRLFLLPAAAMIVANVFVTNFMYYKLLQYQVGTQAGKYIHNNQIAADDFISYRMADPLNAIEFYAQQRLATADTLPNITGRKYILTMENGIKDLQENNRKYTILQQGDMFKVSELTPEFLNPNTRYKAVKKYYLLRME